MLEILLSIPQSFYTGLIIIFTAISTIIPLVGARLRDGRGHRKWYNGFTRSGKIVIVSVIIAALITILKDLLIEKLEFIKEENVKQQTKNLTRTIDSLNTIKQRENTKEIVRTFISSIEKQGLKIDNNSIGMKKFLTESVKNVGQTNYYGNKGEVILSGISKRNYENDTLFLDFKFRTNHKTCLNVKVDIVPILEKPNGEIFGYPRNTIIKDIKIEYGTFPHKILAIPKASNTKNVIIPIKLFWKNEEGKAFNRVDYFYFSPSDNEFGSIENSYIKPYQSVVLAKYPDFK